MRNPSRRLLIQAFAAAAMFKPSFARAEGSPGEIKRVLYMFEEPGCPYCRKWKQEVEQSYLNSPEGRFAALEKRSNTDAEARRLGRIVYSPTFVLVAEGIEVGRIVGYTGADFFWGEIDTLFKRAGFSTR